MLLIALAAMATAQPSEPILSQPTPVRCGAPVTRALDKGSLGARKLGELPPGLAMLAVNKTVRGCPVAVLMERGSDGERRMVPVGAGAWTPTPTGERLKPQRRLERD